jgi:hypothetical protein
MGDEDDPGAIRGSGRNQEDQGEVQGMADAEKVQEIHGRWKDMGD